MDAISIALMGFARFVRGDMNCIKGFVLLVRNWLKWRMGKFQSRVLVLKEGGKEMDLIIHLDSEGLLIILMEILESVEPHKLFSVHLPHPLILIMLIIPQNKPFKQFSPQTAKNQINLAPNSAKPVSLPLPLKKASVKPQPNPQVQ